MAGEEITAPDKGSTDGTSAADKGATGAGTNVDSAAEQAKYEQIAKSAAGGAAKKHIAEAFKSDEFKAIIGEAIAAQIPKPDAPKEPEGPKDDISLVKQELEVMKKVAAEERQERAKADKKARDTSLKSGIRDMLAGLDGGDGKPKISQKWAGDLAKLIEGGSGLTGKPELNEDGDIVVKDAAGDYKSLTDILANGYFGNEHWALDRFSATGSGGGRGATGPSGQTADVPKLSTTEGKQKFDELAETDPEAARAVAQKQIQASRERMARAQGGGRRR